MLQKQKIPRDPAYLKWIRTKCCCHCGYKYDIAAHHTESGGMGIKGSDYSAVPLCSLCHAKLHQGYAKGGFWTPERLKLITDRYKSAYENSSKKCQN